MYQDFKDLLSAFHDHGVKYCWGYAVSFHGQPRATKDIDLFIKADSANAKATHAALIAFGVPLHDIAEQDLANHSISSDSGRNRWAVDIIPGVDGVDFDSAWERRVEGAIDADLTAVFISRDDLIASKLAAGRLRDRAEVEEIRAAGDAQR